MNKNKKFINEKVEKKTEKYNSYQNNKILSFSTHYFEIFYNIEMPKTILTNVACKFLYNLQSNRKLTNRISDEDVKKHFYYFDNSCTHFNYKEWVQFIIEELTKRL